MSIELLTGLLGLALFAVFLRSAILPLLVRSATICSGVLLYASLQYVYTRWPDIMGILESSSTGVQVGLLLGVCLELALLGLIIMLPFSPSRREELESQLGIVLLEPPVYLLVWGVGSLVYHLAVVSPHVVAGSFIWDRHDGLLIPYLALGFLTLVLFRMRRVRARSTTSSRSVLSLSAPTVPRTEPVSVTGEEVRLKRRVDALRREAELAERRWAATVLQERAARIHAERFAREFAAARREIEKQASAEKIPFAMTLEEAFRVLRLTPGCTAEQARDAYCTLITKYHPDKVSLFGSQIHETAERETKRINMAYERLKKSLK